MGVTKMKTFYTILLLAVVQINAFFFPKVDTVEDLDLASYTGRWYEGYSSLIQRATFQRNSYCTTADYSLKPNGAIKVINSGRLKSPTGEENTIEGEAKVVDANEPGALNVKFSTGPQGDKANYLVVKLGPVVDGKYDYTVITTDYKALVWVLARNPETFAQKYEKDVLAYLKKNGYNWFINRPRKTYQGKDCIYQ